MKASKKSIGKTRMNRYEYSANKDAGYLTPGFMVI